MLDLLYRFVTRCQMYFSKIKIKTQQLVQTKEAEDFERHWICINIWRRSTEPTICSLLSHALSNVACSHGPPQKFFQVGAKSIFSSSSSGCWRCNANGRTQNASLFSHHKANAHCYGNSCIQCFPSKKILHEANVCFIEHGYFKTELAEF